MAREGNGGVSEAGMQIEMFQNKPQLHNEHKDTCCAGVQGVCVCVSDVSQCGRTVSSKQQLRHLCNLLCLLPRLPALTS